MCLAHRSIAETKTLKVGKEVFADFQNPQIIKILLPNKLAKLRDAIAISKSETMNDSLTD